MKYSSIIILSLSILILTTGCKQSTLCNECNDKALVKINHTDATPPVFQWSVSEAKTDGAVITSSIGVVPQGTQVDKNMAVDLSYNVFVNATDNESGIKTIKLEGGFTFSCGNANGLFLGHGNLDKQSKSFTFENCALKTWDLADNKIERYTSCGTREFINSDLTFVAIAENFAGKKDTSRITVHFKPGGL